MIQSKPIGIVPNSMTTAHRDTRWDGIESEIGIDDEWRDVLDGLVDFPHIWVMSYFDRVHAPDLPLVRRFTTRSPSHPHPIGICAVQLLDARGTLLRVRGLDALNGIPVLDLKPYLERGDAIQNTRTSEWIEKWWTTSRTK